MNKRQLGKFRLDVRHIEDHSDTLWQVMGTVVPIRAEFMYDSNCIEYIALSHSFPVVGLGSQIPWYRAIIKDGKVVWELQNE